ncbi:MAG TPA: hypothetical protein VF407_17290, partial [Polyangiaceae bacterium]
MRAGSIVVLVGVLSAAGAACSLFVSTDDLQSGDADGGLEPIADGAVDAIDAGAKDANADADAAPGPFCATHPGHTFCADFDESTDAATGWSASETKNGTLVLDEATFVSPPRSMESIAPATSSSSEADARLGLDFVTPPKTVRLEMDVMVCDFSDAGSGGYIELFKLAFGGGFNADGLELQMRGNGAGFVRTDAPVKDYFFNQVVPSNEWLHLAMDVAIGKAGSIKVVMNDVNVLDQEGIDTSQQSDGGVGYHAAVVGLYSSGTPAC